MGVVYYSSIGRTPLLIYAEQFKNDGDIFYVLSAAPVNTALPAGIK
jgi:hypothetical protein